MHPLRNRQHFGDWVLPAYEDHSVVNVPGTAAAVLGAAVGPRLPSDVHAGVQSETVSKVLVILVDGLGDDRWQRDCDGPFFAGFDSVGPVSPLTPTVPSSSTTAITSVHTGTRLAEHGIFG